MQNEPQLSAQLKSKYNDLRPYIKSGVVQEKIDEVFNWFATALEEQRAKYAKKISAIPTDSKDYGNGYIVYGLIDKDQVLAILNGKEE